MPQIRYRIDDRPGSPTNPGQGIRLGEDLGATWCATCLQPLDGDQDEDPTGDAGLPICGECDRARNFDADVESRLV